MMDWTRIVEGLVGEEPPLVLPLYKAGDITGEGKPKSLVVVIAELGPRIGGVTPAHELEQIRERSRKDAFQLFKALSATLPCTTWDALVDHLIKARNEERDDQL